MPDSSLFLMKFALYIADEDDERHMMKNRQILLVIKSEIQKTENGSEMT